jgi:DNA polymerase-3 subunit alpha
MAKMKDKMIEGGEKVSGISRPEMDRFWKQLEDFAAYCFNKSHAACYGLIAYQTAYLKAHYPAAFMAALMTSDYDDTDRLAIEITECKHMGIDVLPPDVNESFLEFSVVPGKSQIRFGMNAIKNVGTHAVEEMLRARHIDGAFTSIEDFFAKVNVRIVNRKVLESLVKAGAFDRFGDRSELLHNLDVLLAYGSRLQKEALSGQVDLFGALGVESEAHKPKLILEKAVTVYNQRDQLLWERELLGLYLSQDPLAMYAAFLGEQCVSIAELKPVHDGRAVTVGGSVLDIREITTKNGQKMAFIKVEDQFGALELILFPSSYQQTLGLWERDKVVLVRGKVSAKDKEGNLADEIKILVDDAREITAEQAANYQATGRKRKGPTAKKSTAAVAAPVRQTAAAPPVQQRVFIRLPDSKDQELLLKLKQTIDECKGPTAVVLVLGTEDSKQIIKLPGGITSDEAVLHRLSALAGPSNVKIH